MRYLLLILIGFISTTCLGQMSESDQELIADICEKYASCSSYQDSGELQVKMILHESGYETISSADFQTVFSRDKGFRFSFKKYRNNSTDLSFENIIHKDVDSTLSTYYSKFNSKPEPEIRKLILLYSIASVTGTTYEVGRYLSGLLLEKELEGFSLLKPRMGELGKISDEVYSEEDCYRFKWINQIDQNIFRSFVGSDEEESNQPNIAILETIYWFSKKDFLLKKVEKTHTSKDFTSKVDITYQSTMGQKVEPQLLELNLPKK